VDFRNVGHKQQYSEPTVFANMIKSNYNIILIIKQVVYVFTFFNI